MCIITYIKFFIINFVTAKECYRSSHHESLDIGSDVLLFQSTTRNFNVLAQNVAARNTSVSTVSALEVQPRCSQPLQRSRDHNQSLRHDWSSRSLSYVRSLLLYKYFIFPQLFYAFSKSNNNKWLLEADESL